MEGLVKNNFEAFYNGKKVFVTGHTGFKGSWLVTWLCAMGARVKGYALAPEGDDPLYYRLSPHITIQSVLADIRDKKKLSKEINDFSPDVIFHLAAQALVRRSYELPSETFDVNVAGTANVLESVISLPGKCTVVVITTDKVYENKETQYHYKEEDRLGGYDPYSASKAATEIVVSSFRDSFFNVNKYPLHQKTIISARAGNVIGGGDWSKDRIIPDIVRALKAGAEANIRNPGSVRPWQHVLEPLGGYLLLGYLAHTGYNRLSGAYNFGPRPNDHLPVSELANIAVNCWGGGSWKDVSDSSQPHEAGLLQLDISRAEKELSWVPKLTATEAIEWTINWYKNAKEDAFPYTVSQIQNYLQR